MENRWLVLVITAIVSAVSLWICDLPATRVIIVHWGRIVGEYLSPFGVSPPWNVVPFLLVQLPLHWFYPIALQLGLARTAMWIGLLCLPAWPINFLLDKLYAGIAPMPQIYICVASLHGLASALLGFALIGRRTRPWMSAFAGLSIGVFSYAYYEAGILRHVGMLPYAAILIFGTDLIPKMRASEAATD